VVVEFAMRYGQPSVEQGVQKLRAQGVERLLLLPLYPQYAASSSGSALDAAFAALMKLRNMPEVRTVRHYHDHPAYIAALAAQVEAHWRQHGRGEKLLMSFHGVPRYTLDKGDPYPCECHKTGRLLAEALGLAASDYVVCFQSRFGRTEWVKPYTSDMLRKLAIPSLVGNIAEPLMWLVAFGYGMGALVGQVSVGGAGGDAKVPYILFLASGSICMSAMNAATFEALYSAFSRMHVQKTWDAILNTPLSLDHVLAGELVWADDQSGSTNITVNLKFTELAEHFPFIGVAVWVAIILTIPVRRHDWELMPETIKGSVFLLSLVLCASMMPVEQLPPASWVSALALGFISAVFDNIPLTALALRQGGYDWGVLAYAVGFGGSMLWFGSSAGVALSNMYPEAKSAVQWVRNGWHVPVAYVTGFMVLMAVLGWHPDEGHKKTAAGVGVEKPLAAPAH
jgi:hypothetical protein